MHWSPEQIRQLLERVRATRERELDCGECLEQLAPFAERELAGLAIPAALEAVKHHLDTCGDCREEYESLLAALRVLENDSRGS